MILILATLMLADPAPDIAALIECRATPADYGDLARPLSERRVATMRRLGLTAEQSHNLMLDQFRLSRPITVFGRTTKRIAFNGNGILAVLAGDDAAALATALGMTPALDRPGKFLAEKLVREDEAGDGDIAITTRVMLNVSTVDSHPGQTLAGCSYSIEMD